MGKNHWKQIAWKQIASISHLQNMHRRLLRGRVYVYMKQYCHLKDPKQSFEHSSEICTCCCTWGTLPPLRKSSGTPFPSVICLARQKKTMQTQMSSHISGLLFIHVCFISSCSQMFLAFSYVLHFVHNFFPRKIKIPSQMRK